MLHFLLFEDVMKRLNFTDWILTLANLNKIEAPLLRYRECGLKREQLDAIITIYKPHLVRFNLMVLKWSFIQGNTSFNRSYRQSGQ